MSSSVTCFFAKAFREQKTYLLYHIYDCLQFNGVWRIYVGGGMDHVFSPRCIQASISSTVRGTSVSSSAPVAVTNTSSSIRTCGECIE